MGNDPVDGGTVKYQRVEYLPDVEPRAPWKVWFTAPGQGTPRNFTDAEGEAMGLTPPEPAPPSTPFAVVLDELIAVEPDEPFSREDVAQSIVDMLEVAGLLRDASQDPRPASEPESPTPCDECETTGRNCIAHRSQPKQDDTPGIDFDTLPIGTVLADKGGDLWVKLDDGWQCSQTWVHGIDPMFAPYTVVYQPAPLSPGECLRGLLAGRDDADELIEYAAKFWPAVYADREALLLRQAIGDAAREVA